MKDLFGYAADVVTAWAASWQFLLLSIVAVAVWVGLGPAFGWSEAWNFAGNQPMTTLTYLLGILILHSQARDTKAVQLKLDELVRAEQGARDELAGIERKPESELEAKASPGEAVPG